MRRIRHLEQCDYIVAVGQKTEQVLTLSNQYNCLLQRTYDKDLYPDFSLRLHAKFNSDQMNGIQVMTELLRNEDSCSCAIVSCKLYRVSEADWSETFISNISLSASGNRFAGTINQATLSTNELSGFECYAIEVLALRRRKSFNKKIWFNHLGVYDSVIRLRHDVDRLEILKVDE